MNSRAIEFEHLMLNAKQSVNSMNLPSLRLHDLRVAAPIQLPKLGLKPEWLLGDVKGENKNHWEVWGVVVILHLLVATYFSQRSHQHDIALLEVTPIEVSLVEPTASSQPEPQPTKIERTVEHNSANKPVVEKLSPEPLPQQRTYEADLVPKSEPVKSDLAKKVTDAAPVREAETLKSEEVPVTSAKVDKKEQAVEPPKFGVSYLNNPEPEYPRMAKRNGEQGKVILKVFVSAEGKAESVTIKQGSGFDSLDNAALKAVQAWRFVPARKGAEAVSAYVNVPITFALD